MTFTEILHAAGHAALHAAEELLSLLPFLFLTYLLMEFLEHRAGTRFDHAIRRTGRVAPLFGGLLGAVPQCGFSAAAAGLYAGRVITLGTLVAVFLSTSDEMLPLLLANQTPVGGTLALVGIKAGVGILCGFAVDFILRLPLFRGRACEDCDTYEQTHSHEEHDRSGHDHDDHDHDGHDHHAHVDALCRRDNCRCEGHSLPVAALIHTAQIALFLFLVSFTLGLVMELGGEEARTWLVGATPLLATLLAGVIGLIPNCAASVLLTKLYLAGALSLGGMLCGLLCGAGVGLLVLFRTNRPRRQSLLIVMLLLAVGLVFGVLSDAVGLDALLGLRA